MAGMLRRLGDEGCDVRRMRVRVLASASPRLRVHVARGYLGE